jgi:probable F420-dependent oxidoreductase
VIDIGSIGIWTHTFDELPAAQAAELIVEVEELGYGAVWVPEAVSKEPLVHAALLLGASSRITVATGIASIYARDAMTAAAAQRTLTEAFPDRFLLGLGVSHAPLVEGIRGHEYTSPVTTMREYLDRMDNALYFGAAPTTSLRRVIGALGPKMLALAAERTDGAHPYNVPVEHTAQARSILGPDRLLAPEVAVALETDAGKARDLAREHLKIYFDLPNYMNNLKRLGFTDDDVAAPGSDRLIDALVAWGDVDAITARVGAHRAAGADHVAIQVLGQKSIDAWRELAPALAGA